MSLSLCSLGLQNTGDLTCGVSRGVLKKLFICNASFDAGDYADETALFNELVRRSKLSKSDPEKVFVINEAQEIAYSGEANKEGNLGLGFKIVTLEGRPAYTVKIFGSGDLLKRYRAMNNKTVKVFEYDANGVFFGTKSGASFNGFDEKLFFTGNNLATGQAVEEGVITFTMSVLSISQYKDNVYYASLAGFNIEDVKALNDAQLRNVSNVTNVYKIAAEILGSKITGVYNIYDDYAALIAGLTFAAATGANYATTLAITSIALDAALKAFTVTLDSTAYTALASTTKIRLSGPTPTVLDGDDVTNLELLPVILVKP